MTSASPSLLWKGSVEYGVARQFQNEVWNDVSAGGPEVFVAIEHPPVYTCGSGTHVRHLGEGEEALVARGAQVVWTDRGGSVTFHGEGQLVLYPIVRLREHFPIPGHPAHGDVVAYVRWIEGCTITWLATLGVEARRREGYTGVWVGHSKLAAIGVKVARGVTIHGLALNVVTDLAWFSHITPCGIEDGGVTSLERCGVTMTVEEAAHSLGKWVCERLPLGPQSTQTMEPVAASV